MTEFSNPFMNTKVDIGGKVMTAVNENSPEKLLKAISENADIEFTRTDATPLMVAVQNKKTEIAKILIDNGANIYVKNRTGFSLLQSAIKNGDNEIVRILITKKASINSKDKDGFSPLLTAIQYKNFDSIKWLLTENCVTDVDVEGKNIVEYFKEVVDYEKHADNPAVYELHKILNAYNNKVIQSTAIPSKPIEHQKNVEENISTENSSNKVNVAVGRLSTIKKKN